MACRILGVDNRNAWVRSANGKAEFFVGRTQFSEDERKRLGIQTVSDGKGMTCKMDSSLFKQQAGSMNFPAGTNCNGTIIGFVVESKWLDGTNGWWCIPHENPLGTKQLTIDLKTESNRGMNVSIKGLS